MSMFAEERSERTLTLAEDETKDVHDRMSMVTGTGMAVTEQQASPRATEAGAEAGTTEEE